MAESVVLVPNSFSLHRRINPIAVSSLKPIFEEVQMKTSLQPPRVQEAAPQPEISLEDVLGGLDRVFVDLAPLNRLSGAERAALIKLAISAEKPTGSVSKPSTHFATYVQYAVSDNLTKAVPAPRDVMRQRLWSAAQHDVFMNTGGIASMLDAGGLARVDFSEYQRIIDVGLQPLIDAGY